jgi:hypothetical protein
MSQATKGTFLAPLALRALVGLSTTTAIVHRAAPRQPRRTAPRYGHVTCLDRRRRSHALPTGNHAGHNWGAIGLDWGAVGEDLRNVLEREKQKKQVAHA